MQRTTLVAGGAIALMLLTAAANGASGGERHDQGGGRGHDGSNDHHGKSRDKDDDHDQGRQLSRAQVRRLVERSLPGWDEEILEVQDGRRWIEDVSFDRVLGVLGEQPVPQDLPPGARQFRDDKRTVKLDPARGKLRYVSRERAWSFERNFQKPAFDPRLSQSRVLEAVRGLGLPLEEAREPQVETQMGAGARAGARRATDTFQMYRLVRLQRQVGKLPVFGSGIQAAISHEGQVQRLQVSWPSFALVAALRLRPRPLVVDEAVQKILDQQPGPDTRVRASLVYAPQPDEKGGLRYLPAVQLAVASPPTPYLVLIPVAEAVEEEEEAPTPIP